MATAGLVIAILAVAACSTVQPSSAPATAAIATIQPTLGATALATAPPAPSPTNTAFHFDVVNRTGGSVVVSVASDVAAELPGFAPGQSGTIEIELGNPTNGIGVEIQDGKCGVLATATYPTPTPFTLVIENAGESGHLRLSTQPGTAASPIPLPSNSIVGCGG